MRACEDPFAREGGKAHRKKRRSPLPIGSRQTTGLASTPRVAPPKAERAHLERSVGVLAKELQARRMAGDHPPSSTS
jgi:hypothetical protein